jgi:hypothetical protein
MMTRGIANTSPLSQKLKRKERRGKERICILFLFTVSNRSCAFLDLQVGEQVE